MHALFRSRRLSALAAVGAAAVLLVGCGGGGGDGGDDDAPAGDAAQLTALDNEYDPATLTLPAGSNQITITNEGDVVHNFVIADLDVDSDLIQPGESATVTVDVPAGGIDFHCTLHPEMTGTIEVAA